MGFLREGYFIGGYTGPTYRKPTVGAQVGCKSGYKQQTKPINVKSQPEPPSNLLGPWAFFL